MLSISNDTRVALVVLLGLLWSGAFPVLAGQDVAADRVNAVLEQFLVMKRQSIAGTADLTTAEQRRFWPVYDSYETAMRPVLHSLLTLLDQYARHRESISDAEADQIIDALISSSGESRDVQRQYLERFREILPAKKVLDVSAVIYGPAP